VVHTGFWWGDLREKTLGRPIRRWGHIKMDFKEVRRKGLDWIDLFQKKDRYRALVNAVMSMRVPYWTKCWKFLD